jgi:MoxR-like ATPase
LLTRFTEPNELFGPVDIEAFRQGRYQRRTEGMLPEAEVVFLDEIFKSNSAILNSLLTLLNERVFRSGNQFLRCPLLSVFGASNEPPSDEALVALYDRFLLRIRAENLQAHHFNDLLALGMEHEKARLAGAATQGLLKGSELEALGRTLSGRLTFSDDFLSTYKGLIFQIRAEGVTLSDRRVVKFLKLFAASALIDGRSQADAGDLFVLKHVWNTEDQAPLVAELVEPVVDAFYQRHPERQRFGALGVGLEALAGEIERIRHVLTGGAEPSDLQLFSQLRALGEIKVALAQDQGDEARLLEQRVAELLDTALKGGRFVAP